jgi:3-hydroxypropanoate dehydrogenase
MRLDDAALDVLFRESRTYHGFDGRPVSDATIHELYETMKWGPTSANSNPGRFVFVRSPEAKALLAPALSAGNHDKTMAAPCTVIVAYDLEFYERLPVLFPHVDARSWFVGKPAHIQATAFRNGTLQGAYLIIAARALGPRRRRDVGLRQPQGRRGVLRRHLDPLELPRQPRARRPGEGAQAQPAPRVRRGVQHPLTAARAIRAARRTRCPRRPTLWSRRSPRRAPRPS